MGWILDLLAYFIPGFHRDKFNDDWWGEGFTEWDNVLKSKPIFKGHSQPNIPLDGTFDLMSLDTLSNNFKRAKEFGIDSFIFYDYWYEGKRPLGSVLDLILKNKKLDFSFSLCWANHSWTKSWKNRSGSLDVLIEQNYGDSTSINQQADFYVKIFSDPRYYKVDGRPLFQIYQANDVPNLDQFSSILIQKCLSKGLKKPFLVANYSGSKNYFEMLKVFDALVMSNPTLALYSEENPFISGKNKLFAGIKDVRNYPKFIKRFLYPLQDLLPDQYELFDYDLINSRLLKQASYGKEVLGDKLLFSCFTAFDNTPRYKKRAKIIENSSSYTFLRTLQDLFELNKEAPYIAINAWNEWGEGMVLEPSSLHGYSYLESIKRFKEANQLL